MKKGTLIALISTFTFIAVPNFVRADKQVTNQEVVEVCASCEVSDLTEAVGLVKDGGTVNLKNGTYALEDIVFSKNVIINGESKEGTIIKLGKTISDWITVSPSKKLTLKSVTLDGNKESYKVNNAIKVLGSLDIQDVLITKIVSSNNVGTGIYSSGESDAGSINVNNVTMKDVEFSGIRLVNSAKNVNTIIDNFTYVGRGTINDQRQYGIIVEDGRQAKIANSNISGCLNDGDEIGNRSAGIWVHGGMPTLPSNSYLSCHEEILEEYRSFTTPKCSSVTNVYVETSDLTNNSFSLYIGKEEQDDAAVVVRYSKLKNVAIRDKSYIDSIYNYWEGATKELDVYSKIVTDRTTSENPVIIFKLLTDGFYRSASAAINKSPILNFALNNDNLEFTKGNDYDISSYVNVGENMFRDVSISDTTEKDTFMNNVWKFVNLTSNNSNVVGVNGRKLNALNEGTTTIKVDVTGYNSLVIGTNVLSGNPQTSDIPVIIICFVGLIGLGYGIYKVNQTKYDY